MKLKRGQNNLFRGLNGPRSGIKRDMWAPLEKKTNIKGKREELEQHDREETEGFIFFILLVYFSYSRKSDRRISSGKERKVLYATRATHGYQKHRISSRIQVKIRKILNFWFFSNYDVLTVIIF